MNTNSFPNLPYLYSQHGRVQNLAEPEDALHLHVPPPDVIPRPRETLSKNSERKKENSFILYNVGLFF